MVSLHPAQVLRIKRKRHQEPLDGLSEFFIHFSNKKVVAQPSEKRSRTNDILGQETELPGNPKFFSLVETVETQELGHLKSKWSETWSSQMNALSAEEKKELQEKKDCLASQKLAESKAARYRIVTQHRNQVTRSCGAFNVLDVAKEEELEENGMRDPYAEDAVMCNLMPMVREYLNVTGTSARPVDTESEGDYVYDIYLRNDRLVPTTQYKMAHLVWEDDPILLPDEEDKSGDDDDYDSNAESNENNDYPDEEDFSDFSLEEQSLDESEEARDNDW